MIKDQNTQKVQKNVFLNQTTKAMCTFFRQTSYQFFYLFARERDLPLKFACCFVLSDKKKKFFLTLGVFCSWKFWYTLCVWHCLCLSILYLLYRFPRLTVELVTMLTVTKSLGNWVYPASSSGLLEDAKVLEVFDWFLKRKEHNLPLWSKNANVLDGLHPFVKLLKNNLWKITLCCENEVSVVVWLCCS